MNIKNNATVPFQVTNAAAGDYLVVTSSGNIGIGSTLPGQKLTVNGNMSLSIGTTTVGSVPCVKSAVGINVVLGYCGTLVGVLCTVCN